MTPLESDAGGQGFKDRKTGLIVFGIFEIITGAYCASLIPLMMLGMVLSVTMGRGDVPTISARTMVPGLVFYALLATWFVWMGIGSIRARRWARAIVLVTSWIWLVGGIFGLVFLLVFLPGMFDQMGRNGPASGQLPAVAKYLVIVFSLLFSVVLYIIIPVALILFYGSKHTKATCERRDPHVRWTDKCPLPVLALSLMFGYCSACIPFTGFYGWAIPFFGSILSGFPGAGVALVASLLFGYSAWGMYRLKPIAWWGAVLVVITLGASACITFSRVSLIELYERMEFPAEQLAMMKEFSFLQTPWMAVTCGFWVVGALLYLLFTKRYFAPNRGEL